MSEKKKSGFIGRFFKIAVLCIAGAAFLALLLVVTLPLWIGPVVTGVAGKVVPDYTGTPFRIDRFGLNPYSGTLGVGGVALSNPDGFGKAPAFSLTGFDMELDVASLFSDTVLVRKIVISDTFVSYYSHDGKNNFDVILENLKKATASGEEEKTAKEVKKDEEKPGKKVIIELLSIAGTKVKLMKSDMMPAFAFPDLELTDIGRKSGGATLEEAWAQIANAVMKSMGEINNGVGALGGLLGDGAKSVSGTLDAGVKDLGDLADGFTRSVRASGKNGGSDGSSGSAVSGITGKTVDAVGDTAKSAVEIVGGTAKGTVDAVGDTTKKAAEGVKNLFKGIGK